MHLIGYTITLTIGIYAGWYLKSCSMVWIDNIMAKKRGL